MVFEIGAMSPPPGVTVDFVHPDSRGYQLTITASVAFAITMLFLSARVYVRFQITGIRNWGWDDSWCIVAVAWLAVYTALCIRGVALGLGTHEWDVSITAFTDEFLDIILLVQVLYGPTIFFIKLALFMLFLRIFNPFKWLRWACYFGIGINFVFYCICATIQGVWCSPAPGNGWTSYVISQLNGTNKCDLTIELSVVQSAINIASDFYILLLPVPAVWQLQLRTSKKLGVISVFMTGLLACVASIVSLVYRTGLSAFGDSLWQLVPALITVLIEMNVGVICCCMPSLASLVRHYTVASKSENSEKTLINSQSSRRGLIPRSFGIFKKLGSGTRSGPSTGNTNSTHDNADSHNSHTPRSRKRFHKWDSILETRDLRASDYHADEVDESAPGIHDMTSRRPADIETGLARPPQPLNFSRLVPRSPIRPPRNSTKLSSSLAGRTRAPPTTPITKGPVLKDPPIRTSTSIPPDFSPPLPPPPPTALSDDSDSSSEILIDISTDWRDNSSTGPETPATTFTPAGTARPNLPAQHELRSEPPPRRSSLEGRRMSDHGSGEGPGLGQTVFPYPG